MRREFWGCGQRALGGVLLALLALSATGCRTKSFLSTRDEVNMGREGTRQIEQEFRVDITSPDAERVRRIGQKVLAHLGEDKRDVPYTVKVLDLKEINAVSLPGGPVYIFRGLLDMVGDDDDALACIIGHELGHVNARHAARQISNQTLQQLLLVFAPIDPTLGQAASLGLGLFNLRYSRDDEYEADRRGISYAHFAGYDPNGITRFFDRLERTEQRQGSGPPEILRTHPLSTSRMDKVEVLIENKNYRFGK